MDLSAQSEKVGDVVVVRNESRDQGFIGDDPAGFGQIGMTGVAQISTQCTATCKEKKRTMG